MKKKSIKETHEEEQQQAQDHAENAASTLPEISIFEKLGNKIAVFLAVLHVSFFSFLGILRYNSFDFNDMDFAIYAQVFWNMLHGSTFSSILRVPLLANHTDIILFFVLPIYAIIRTPALLLVLQAATIGATGYILYRFTTRVLNKTWALTLLALFFLYPPLTYSNLYEFHPVVFAMPFLALAFSSYKENRFRPFFIYAVLAILCKENIPFMIIMFSALALLDRKSLRWITTPFILGVSSFLVLAFVVKPFFNRGIMNFFIAYSDFGNTPKEIVLGMLSSPGMVLTKVVSMANIYFVINILGPVALLPVLSLRELVPVVLVLLQHFLSLRGVEKAIAFHYSLKLVPFIFISSAYGLKKALSSERAKSLGPLAAPFLVTFLLALSLGLNIATNAGVFDRIQQTLKDTRKKQIRQKYVDMIPEDASVMATFRFLSKLSQRKELYSFHHIYMGRYTLSTLAYPLPEKLDYALIDFNNHFVFDFKSPNSYENLTNFFTSYDWEVVDSDDSIVLFKNSGARDLSKIFQVLDKAPSMRSMVNGKINDEIELVGFEWVKGEGDKDWEVRISFCWRCLEKPASDYVSYLVFVDRNDMPVRQDKKYMCYRIHPTQQWQKGQVIREDYWYVFPPDLPRGSYYLKLVMFDATNGRPVPIVSDNRELVDRRGNVTILGL